MGLQEEVSAALAALGASTGEVVDAIADPGRAARALEGEAVVLRAAPPLGPAAAGYAPEPASPVWVRLTRGAREVALVPLRGGEKATLVAVRVEVEEILERCCDAPSCTLQKRRASAWIHLEGGASRGGAEAVSDAGAASPRRLLVAEQRSPESAPPAAVHVIARRLADLLGLPPPEGAAEAEAAIPEPLGAIAPAALARFALRSEGDRIVLRDHESRGPRASAPRNAVIGAALMLVAGLFWAELAAALREGSTGFAVAAGAGLALFILAGVAFLGVARYSARYRAESGPVLALGQGRFIVLPWVSRSGAVDLRPEGRLGAAIPLGELRGVSVQRRARGLTVELDSDHGPIDALTTEDEALARFWSDVVARVAAEVRHPSSTASARQRARAKGRDEAASS